jgi:glycosyltransferase involved in cell wall biosynthesis
MVLEALESVQKQTYTQWRAVIVDNNSSDDTAAAILALNDPKMELVRHATNLGPSGGRNTGISRAQTPWIAFLDSDDIWKPEFLEVVMDQALKHPEVSLFSARSELFRDSDRGGVKEVGVTPETNGDQSVAERLLSQGNFFATSTVVARTDAVRSVGGFDPTLSRSEDTDLWVRLSLHYPSIHLSDVLVRVRLHSGATQVQEDPLDKLKRRIHICSKAMSLLGDDALNVRPLLRRRLRVAWRERAALLSHRGRWDEAALARQRQWELRPLDLKPLLLWTYCRLRGLSSSESNGHRRSSLSTEVTQESELK